MVQILLWEEYCPIIYQVSIANSTKSNESILFTDVTALSLKYFCSSWKRPWMGRALFKLYYVITAWVWRHLKQTALQTVLFLPECCTALLSLLAKNVCINNEKKCNLDCSDKHCQWMELWMPALWKRLSRCVESSSPSWGTCLIAGFYISNREKQNKLQRHAWVLPFQIATFWMKHKVSSLTAKGLWSVEAVPDTNTDFILAGFPAHWSAAVLQSSRRFDGCSQVSS